MIDRRTLLTGSGAFVASAPFVRPSWAQAGPIRLGLLLPYSGTYTALGEAITNGVNLYIQKQGGKIAGRAVTVVKVDDESAPPKATELTTKLVSGEKVDALFGTVHSGVALAMVKIAREEGLPTIVPNAGADAITRAMCAPNVFRSSFGNSQVGYATGLAMAKAGIKKVVTATWKYAAGDEQVGGFKKAFQAGGGQILKDITVPFPDVEFQSVLTEISTLKPDAVYAFYAGGGALKFIKDYAAAGLKDKVPLWGTGFLTDGIEKQAGAAGEGVKTVLHYVDALDNPENKAFIADYDAAFKVAPDVYAVQGYDAMRMLDIGLQAAGGDATKRPAINGAIANAAFASPRGPFRLSLSHNPIQNFYVRELRDGVNRYVGIAGEAVSDETTGCKLA